MSGATNDGRGASVPRHSSRSIAGWLRFFTLMLIERTRYAGVGASLLN